MDDSTKDTGPGRRQHTFIPCGQKSIPCGNSANMVHATMLLITKADSFCFFLLAIRFGLSSQSGFLRQQSDGVGRGILGMSQLSEKCPMQKYACPPAQLESLPTSHNLVNNSEVDANPKMGLFSSEGHLQICFGRIMHCGKKLELRLKNLNFELGTSRGGCGLALQFIGQKRT